MTFGTYVPEQHDAWLQELDSRAEPAEKFLVLVMDQDERSSLVAGLAEKLGDGKFHVLTNAKNIIPTLRRLTPIVGESFEEVARHFDELRSSGESALYLELRRLRPDPKQPPPKLENNAVLMLTTQIEARLRPLRETADEYFLLRDPVRIATKLDEHMKRLDIPWGSARTFQRLQEDRKIHLRQPDKIESPHLQRYRRKRKR